MKLRLGMLMICVCMSGCALGKVLQDHDPSAHQEGREELHMDFEQRLSSMELSLLRVEKFLRDYFDAPRIMADSPPVPAAPGLDEDAYEPLVDPAPSLTSPTPPPADKPEQHAARAPAPARPQPVTDPGQAFYDQALDKYYKGKYVQARTDFAAFEQRYPDSPLLPNALYWLAETHYAQKQYAQSILVFKELTRRFPASRKTPDALLKAGYAYEQLGDIPNALFHLQIVLDDHPRSSAAGLARERMAALSGM